MNTEKNAMAKVVGVGGLFFKSPDPERLLEARPDCVVVTISDFGWTGPYADRAASEFTLQAWAGSPGFRGDPAPGAAHRP